MAPTSIGWFKLFHEVSMCNAATDNPSTHPYKLWHQKQPGSALWGWTAWLCPEEGSLRQLKSENSFSLFASNNSPVHRVGPVPAPVLICRALTWTNLWRPWWQTAETQFSWPAEQWVEQRGWRTSTLSSVCPSHAEPGASTRRQCYLYKRRNVKCQKTVLVQLLLC